MLKIVETALPGVLICEPQVFDDHRGFFFESFNSREFSTLTGNHTTFVQDNHSFSLYSVVRGLHYQLRNPQAKLVRAASGKIFDVAVDLRRSSAHFGKWVGVELSAQNRRQLYIPACFAHGYCVLSDSADILYKTTTHRLAREEHLISWNDTTLNINWPIFDTPILSSKDSRTARFLDAGMFD